MDTTNRLLAAAADHMTPNYRPPSWVLDRGEGALVWDTHGREYLDFVGGLGANVIGHVHPRVTAAINEQAARLCHTSNAFHNAPHVALCQKLASLCFGSRVYLSNSGTEANEAAIKVARRHFHDRGSDRTELVAARGAFHGRSLGALSITDKEAYRRGFGPLVPGVLSVAYGDLQAMEEVVGPRTAAVFLEPIQGNAGVVVPPEGYLAGVRRICDTTGALLVFDEVQTGMGRTAAWFAHQHEAVLPDVLTTAKALGGGLPLGAMITTDEIAQAFQPGTHGSTFGGNPVACAAGLATLSVIEEEGLLEHTAAMETCLRNRLSQLGHRHPGSILEVRGRGLLIGVVLNSSAKHLQRACWQRGLLVNSAGPDVIRLFPPLNVTESELDRCVETLDAALAQAPKA